MIFILKLILVFYATPAVSADFFLSSHKYPFTPSVLPILEYRQNTLIKRVDILFVGETHIVSAYLLETRRGERGGNEVGRQNSYDQENIYFNLIKKFSEIYPNHKKCLYLEYTDNSTKLNKWLNGFHEGRSHYFLINTAIKNKWSIFAVDKPGSIDDGERDEYMSEKISETIQTGECEKGIGVNGKLHLGCDDCLDALVSRKLPKKKVKYTKILSLSSGVLYDEKYQRNRMRKRH